VSVLTGILLAIVGGSLISVQNLLNSRVSQHVGTWTTATWVLGLGCIASLVLGLTLKGADGFTFHRMEPWHWFSGVTGVVVVTSLVLGIKNLGPTLAISIVLTSQLTSALLWDAWGGFALPTFPLTIKHLIGVLVIIAGIALFKLGEARTARAPK